MKTSKLLTVVIVLQGLILAGQWVSGPGLATPAMAQVSDPGAQRIQMIDQLEVLNDKMDKLIGILESGNLQVRVAPPDESKVADPAN